MHDEQPAVNEKGIKAERPVSNFWLRIAAALIDSFLLSFAGFLIGFFFFNSLTGLGSWGRLVGFSVWLPYFGILNSQIGNGQTLGKRLVRIRVADKNGESLPLDISFLRSFVLGLTFFVNGVMLPQSMVMSPIGMLISVVIFGVGGSMLYLYVFNRGTRQSLHDLAAGSYVIKKKWSGPVNLPPMARVHYAVVAVIVLTSIVFAAIVGPKLAAKGPFPELISLQRKLEKVDGVNVVAVTLGKTFDARKQTYLGVTAVMKRKPQSFEQVADQIAALVVSEYPAVQEKNFMGISIVYGFDLGIASGWRRQNFNRTPSEWQSKLTGTLPPTP